MRTKGPNLKRELYVLALLVLLGGCGGGGGGGGGGQSPLVYSGSTSAATITPANASTLVADLFGSDNTAAPIAGASIQGGDGARQGGSGLAGHAWRLGRIFARTLPQAGTGATAGVIPVDDTTTCDSGTMRISGSLNDNGTGTLTVSYNSCRFGDETLSGQATMRVDAFDMMLLAPTDYTVSYPRLAFRATGVSTDSTGEIRVQLNFGGRSEIITKNVVLLDNLTQKMMKTEGLVFVNVYDDMFNPSSFTGTVSGRIFDSVHGYVDATTPVPVSFGTLSQSFPGAGQVLLTGGANRRIRVSALSATMTALALDLDSDGVFENSATLKWTELAGPVGADLLDADGDGMHNSWETAVGLNPNVADAGGDADGDDFSNFAEYRGGGHPGNASSIPSLIVSGVFPVATDIAVANSDTETPGRSGIATDGEDFLVVTCRTLPSAGLLGVPVAAGGQVQNAIALSSDTCGERPAVAFDGASYLVVFSRNGQIHGIRVTPAGTVLDPAGGFAISAAGSNWGPAVAFDGTNYLVVWGKFVSGTPSQYEIYGARVTPQGIALGEFPVFAATGEQILPAVAFGGGNYLVAWRDTRSGSGPGSDTHVYGTRVLPDGTVLDPLGIAIATATASKQPGGIAFDGTNFLVVWDHTPTTNVSPPPEGKIFGRRVSPAGVLLDGTAGSDGIPVSTGPYANHSSAVAFAGTHYLVTWAVGSFPNFPPAGIFAARISRSGSRIDGLPGDLGMPVSGAPASASRYVHPVIAAQGQDGLIAWTNNTEMSGMQKDILGAVVSGF